MSVVEVAAGGLLAGLAAWVIFVRTSQALKFDLHKIPGPKQLPLLGNIGSIIGSSHFHRVSNEASASGVARSGGPSGTLIKTAFRKPISLVQILAQWTSRYGPVFKWSLAGSNVLVITDPEEVNKFCSREMNLPKASAFYTGLNSVSPQCTLLSVHVVPAGLVLEDRSVP